MVWGGRYRPLPESLLRLRPTGQLLDVLRPVRADLVPGQLDTLYHGLHSSHLPTKRVAEEALAACSHLDAILSGGAPLPDHIDTFLTRAGLTIVRGYGSSEVAGGVLFDGRLDEAINSGGIIIIPQPLEAALYTHPGVKECAVIGLPHPHFGQCVTAVIVPADDTTPPTLEELTTLLKPIFGHYSIPKDVIYLPQLPHRSNSKLNRTQLVTLIAQLHH